MSHCDQPCTNRIAGPSGRPHSWAWSVVPPPPRMSYSRTGSTAIAMRSVEREIVRHVVPPRSLEQATRSMLRLDPRSGSRARHRRQHVTARPLRWRYTRSPVQRMRQPIDVGFSINATAAAARAALPERRSFA